MEIECASYRDSPSASITPWQGEMAVMSVGGKAARLAAFSYPLSALEQFTKLSLLPLSVSVCNAAAGSRSAHGSKRAPCR